MYKMCYRRASGVLTGCLVLLGACAVDGGPQSSEPTSTTESAVLGQDCPPSYGSCTNWSNWEDIGPQYCTASGGGCGEYCADPVPGRPPYCDFQIIPTSECCNLVQPSPERDTTLQRYRWCADINGNWCEEIDEMASFVSCDC